MFKRLILAASLTLAVFVLVGATTSSSAPTVHARPTAYVTHRRHCAKLFTVKMAQRASSAVFASTRTVTKHDWLVLLYLDRCQRNPRARGFVRGVYHHDRLAHDSRVYWANPSNWPTATASWFTDGSGGTACGFHAHYGVANKSLPCGTQVDFAYHGHQVTAEVEDRGPFVAGRMWDLGENTKDALAFDGVDTVSYRIH